MQSLKEMQTTNEPAAFDVFPAQSEVHCRQQENPQLLVTSGHWAQDLRREETCRWKCNDMLWFSILLSSSSSQGLNPIAYSFSPWTGKEWQHLDKGETSLALHQIRAVSFGCICWPCYKRWSLALHCWGFPSTSLQSCYPEKLLQTPRTWEAATAKGVRQRTSWWRKQAPSHISAPRSKTGTVVAWAFLWQSRQLMQFSPHLTLSSFGIHVVLQWVTWRGLTWPKATAKGKKPLVLVETALWPTLS